MTFNIFSRLRERETDIQLPALAHSLRCVFDAMGIFWIVSVLMVIGDLFENLPVNDVMNANVESMIFYWVSVLVLALILVVILPKSHRWIDTVRGGIFALVFVPFHNVYFAVYNEWILTGLFGLERSFILGYFFACLFVLMAVIVYYQAVEFQNYESVSGDSDD